MMCCNKSNHDLNNIYTAGLDAKGNHLKITTIVKIQAVMRGYMTRKKMKIV